MRKAATSALRSGRHLSRRLNHSLTTPEVQITTLPNNIRVATESTPGHFTSVGLYVDAGSRYETPTSLGVGHFLERMAFKNTTSRSSEDMISAIDAMGGQIMCTSARESIMYQSSHFHDKTPLALSLISDTVLQPSFLSEELEIQKDAARYEIRELSTKPEMFIPEILHEVAYNAQGLGNPQICPEERLLAIDESLLRRSLREWYQPERIVVAGAGVAHEELVELTDKYFSSLRSPSLATSTASTASKAFHSQPPPAHILSATQPSIYKSLTRAASSYLYPSPDPNNPGSLLSTIGNTKSTYTGGYRFIHDSESDFDHVYVAFEGVGIHDEDIYALATMQVLLGGGGSFSAGGPGKGMYSRLYTHILNHYHQIDHCASFHHIYSDSSLFGLFASFVPAMVDSKLGNTPSQILPHLVHQLSLLLYSPIPVQELNRAKNQLKSSLSMALESRSVQVEDLGRQILVHGRKIPIDEMTAKIDEVTPEAIRRVANRVFGPNSGNQATVVCMGHQDLPDWKPTLRKYGVASL